MEKKLTITNWNRQKLIIKIRSVTDTSNKNNNNLHRKKLIKNNEKLKNKIKKISKKILRIRKKETQNLILKFFCS